MEVAIGVYEATKTTAEAAYLAAKGLTNPTAPVKATFRQIKAPSIPRSSHTLCVVGQRAYIFGGEIAPRQPVDNAMHIITIPSATLLQDADYERVDARAQSPHGEVPCARVGHAAAVIGSAIYMFGGRGGANMSALEEQGRVWVFDTTTRLWSHLDPDPKSALKPPFPAARSYHTAAASVHPLPQVSPNTTNVITDITPDEKGKRIPEPAALNTYGTFFVHAGCLSSGGRTCDVWAFDIASQTWAAFPDAPEPARGGTSLAIVDDRLYRFGGFDGKTEVGGAVDFLDLMRGTFDDKLGTGEMALHPAPPSRWQSNLLLATSDDGGPCNRSVCGFVPASTGQGRKYLLVICGEGDPSSSGHAAAGKFLDDVWTFQLKPEGGTAAAVKDAVRCALMGKDTGEAQAWEVKYYNEESVMVQEGQPKPMGRRGWFASSPAGDAIGGDAVIVWGGVSEDNARMGDGWIMTIE